MISSFTFLSSKEPQVEKVISPLKAVSSCVFSLLSVVSATGFSSAVFPHPARRPITRTRLKIIDTYFFHKLLPLYIDLIFVKPILLYIRHKIKTI